MLECTGATPRPLDNSPPTPLVPLTHSENAPLNPPPTMVGSKDSETTAVAPLSDGCVGTVPLGDHVREQSSEAGADDDSKTEGTDVSALASTEGPMPRPLPRNMTLEFGDVIGEKATRAALNRAAAIGERRIDPRAVVAVGRAAVAKLQNPRVASINNKDVCSCVCTTFCLEGNPLIYLGS